MTGPTDPAETYFEKGLWGHDGSVWRKLPMVWGYSDRWAERSTTASASAGSNTVKSTAVPAGEVWVLHAMAARNKDTDVAMQFLLNAGAVVLRVKLVAAPGVNVWVLYSPTELVLAEGDTVDVLFLSCTSGDELNVDFWGYKMAVA